MAWIYARDDGTFREPNENDRARLCGDPGATAWQERRDEMKAVCHGLLLDAERGDDRTFRESMFRAVRILHELTD